MKNLSRHYVKLCGKKLENFFCLNFDYPLSTSFLVELFELKQIFFITNVRVGIRSAHRLHSRLSSCVFLAWFLPVRTSALITAKTFHCGGDILVEKKIEAHNLREKNTGESHSL